MREEVSQLSMTETHLLETNSPTLMWVMVSEKERIHHWEVDSHLHREALQLEDHMDRKLHLEKYMRPQELDLLLEMQVRCLLSIEAMDSLVKTQ